LAEWAESEWAWWAVQDVISTYTRESAKLGLCTLGPWTGLWTQ